LSLNLLSIPSQHFLFMAGSETTARVLTVTLVHILEDATLLARLRNDLDPVFAASRGALPDSRQLESVALLKATIREGLRMASTITNRGTLIAREEDLTCQGVVIPRGVSRSLVITCVRLSVLIPRQTQISMTQKDIHFDPDIFTDPYTFSPDRWLQAEASGQRLDHHLVAWSKGSRSCLGISLAYAELYLCVASLVVRFDLSLFDFNYDRDLKTVRDAFLGAPGKSAREVRVIVIARRT
jgi:cytochrome P450